MIGCYDKVPERATRKWVLTSAPRFRVQCVVAGASHQQERGSWSQCIPSQEAQREECCYAFSFSFACSQAPLMVVLPTSRVNLLEMLHRCGQKCVSLG